MVKYIAGNLDSRHDPITQPKDGPPTEHRCGRCYGPYGKSALRCANEPPPGPPERWVVKSDGAVRGTCESFTEAEQYAVDLNFNHPDVFFHVEKVGTE
jgi:hypothetical protein